jgi:hypothetical protein
MRAFFVKVFTQKIFRRKKLIYLFAPSAFVIILAIFLFSPSPGKIPRINTHSKDKLKSQPESQVTSWPYVVPIFSPVSLSEEALRGYNLPGTGFPGTANEQQQKIKDDESGKTGSGGGQTEEVFDQKRVKPNNKTIGLKEEVSKDSPGGQASAVVTQKKELTEERFVRNNAYQLKKPDSSKADIDKLQDDAKLIEKRAAAAGLSEMAAKKIVQSYLELCRILPQSEAEKVIIMKIRSTPKP